MAAIFGFKTRSPDRDRETDKARFEQLSQILVRLAAEIESEGAGIRNRYESVSANAAFLAEAVDNEAASPQRIAEMDQLTSSLKACHRRIDALEAQAALIDRLRHLVDTFVVDGRRTDEESTTKPAGGKA